MDFYRFGPYEGIWRGIIANKNNLTITKSTKRRREKVAQIAKHAEEKLTYRK